MKIWVKFFIHLYDLPIEVRQFSSKPDLMDDFRDDFWFLPLGIRLVVFAGVEDSEFLHSLPVAD